MQKRLPVTVITGFLGSGKTTLLRELLVKSKLKLAVIINEFGTIGLDGDLVKKCGFCEDDELDYRIIELNNGCLCCTVQDDFLPTIQRLLNRASSLDGIIIETSGLALPNPLVMALQWPEIKTKVFLNSVVTLVDSEALSLGSPVADLLSFDKQREQDQSLEHIDSIDHLFDNQLKSADIVLMSRSDLIDKEIMLELQYQIRNKVTPGTSLIPISNGIIDPNILLNCNDSEFNNRNRNIRTLSETEHDHDHLDVICEDIKIEASVEKDKLVSVLNEVCLKYKTLRIKGRLWLKDKVIPLQVQMVGKRLTMWFEEVPLDSWRPAKEGIDLVIISLKEGASDAIRGSFI